MREPFLPIVRRLRTSGGNPGDIFIAEGLEWLFEQAIPDLTWLRTDKFSKKNTLNSLRDFRDCHIVYGGTPQYNNYDYWSYWYDIDLWKEIAPAKNLKIAAMAGGSGYPDPHMSPEAFTADCLSSQKTREILALRSRYYSLVTTRDIHSQVLLQEAGIDSHLLPCSAFWLYKAHPPLQIKNKGYWILTPASWVAVPDFYFTDGDKAGTVFRYVLSVFNEMVKLNSDTKICVHSQREYNYYKDKINPHNLIYKTDWRELLKFYSEADGVLSGRLHGALPLFGLPGRKVHLMAVDTRNSAANFFPEITRSTYNEDPEAVVAKFSSGPLSDPDKLLPYEVEYIRLVRDAGIK